VFHKTQTALGMMALFQRKEATNSWNDKIVFAAQTNIVLMMVF